MIQRIRLRFILIAVAVLSAAMIALTAVINISNWAIVRGELRETLEGLAESGERTPGGKNKGGRDRRMQNSLYESRYFLVRINGQEGRVIDSSRASGITEEERNEVIIAALSSGKNFGMVGDYMYLVRTGDRSESTAVFLNCETKMDGLRRLLLVSALACAGGILIAWLLVFLFSRRAVQPLIRNAVQQKQFITDAGHELKTPLTVISANMDALELSTDKNEWIDSTREQVSDMRGLVNDMIYLSRLDEDGAVLDKEAIDFSALVQEEVKPFQGMADFMGKTLNAEITDGQYVLGDRNALRRLVRQLCDNAVKYAPEEDTILIRLSREGREIRLTEENSLADPLSDEALSHLFDWFYRPDASRSRESGGYGIGLSMVRSIVEKHGGRIRAERTGSGKIRFVCFLPAASRTLSHARH